MVYLFSTSRNFMFNKSCFWSSFNKPFPVYVDHFYRLNKLICFVMGDRIKSLNNCNAILTTCELHIHDSSYCKFTYHPYHPLVKGLFKIHVALCSLKAEISFPSFFFFYRCFRVVFGLNTVLCPDADITGDYHRTNFSSWSFIIASFNVTL